jgi:NADH-quinone oxidoreductase subunit M
MPLLAFVLWIGLNPEPFTRVLHVTVEHLLTQVHSTGSYATAGPLW